uniref:Putative ovule protein n=1 Tax=Solanum chacoense TaxID=4108 RepID=A0A0V0HH58_SOLCH
MANSLRDIAIAHIEEARTQWTKEHTTIVARPVMDGSVPNVMLWMCSIPGRNTTDWAGGKYQMRMIFDNNYPTKPPKCMFDRNFFHPNVYPSGLIYMSLLDEDDGWRPNTTIREILEGVQDLLAWPDKTKPVQDSFDLYFKDHEAYKTRVRQQAASYLVSH